MSAFKSGHGTGTMSRNETSGGGTAPLSTSLTLLSGSAGQRLFSVGDARLTCLFAHVVCPLLSTFPLYRSPIFATAGSARRDRTVGIDEPTPRLRTLARFEIVARHAGDVRRAVSVPAFRQIGWVYRNFLHPQRTRKKRFPLAPTVA
jgi:hypothetical protein